MADYEYGTLNLILFSIPALIILYVFIVFFVSFSLKTFSN